MTTQPYYERDGTPLTFGSLFAGIGGFDLGFERAGMRCEWQVEIDPYCRKVLAKHWPNVRRHDDVRTFPPTEGDWSVDIICGGFPCQDISFAGNGAGIDGERSGLWTEFSRVVRVLRPRFVVVENVAALTSRGLDRVLGDLAASGYDAEWQCIPACAVGAPHIRDRIWIVAYSVGNGREGGSQIVEGEGTPGELDSRGEATGGIGETDEHRRWWEHEPAVGRMAHGVSNRLDRLRGLGNAVVPQVAEWIGRRIVEANQ